ncbi:MAG TPA: hypothetical protein VF424_05285 [Vicinamibacterales bacterium]
MTLRRLIVFVLAALLIVPLAIGVTLLMMPFFSWIEARFGIEAVGHAGPAEWCYATVYVTMLAVLTVVAHRVIGRSRP